MVESFEICATANVDYACLLYTVTAQKFEYTFCAGSRSTLAHNLLSQLRTSMSLTLSLYVCTTRTKVKVRVFINERITNQKSYSITLSKHETAFHICIQVFEQ